MATYRAIIEGLQIIAETHSPNGIDGYGVDAEHDVLYAGPEASKILKSVSDKLLALGWFVDDDIDRFAIYT